MTTVRRAALVVAVTLALLAALAFHALPAASVTPSRQFEALIFEPVRSGGRPTTSGQTSKPSAAPPASNSCRAPSGQADADCRLEVSPPDSRTSSPAASAPATVAPSLRPVPRKAAASRTSTPTGQSVTGHSGRASFMAPAYGSRYLALPGGPGITVRICHGDRCIRRTSTDAGPDLAMQRAGRVADLSFADFRWLCDCDPWAVGLLEVSVAPAIAPPETATGGTRP